MGGVALSATGEVFVGDLGNHRVQKFTPDGTFLLMFGKEVDLGPSHPGDVCTAVFIAEGDTCGAGTSGIAPGQLSNERSGSYLSVASNGVVYVGDVGRIQKFGLLGDFQGEVELEGDLADGIVGSLAVAPTGDLWVASPEDPGRVHKLSPTGEDLLTPALISEEPGPSAIPSLPIPLATDRDGNVYAAMFNVVERIEEEEGQVSEWGAGEVKEVLKFSPDGQQLIPAGKGLSRVRGFEGQLLLGLATNIVNDAGEEDIYVLTREPGKAFLSAYGPAPDKWEPPKAAPQILAQYPIELRPDSAVLGAEINPKFWADTTLYFEYGTGVCEAGGCPNTAPVPPGQVLSAQSSGLPLRSAGITLPGLAPSTTYHYRVVAQSTGSGGLPVKGVGGTTTTPGSEGTFTTAAPPPPPPGGCANEGVRAGPALQTANCRAYELVSPVEKNATDILPLHNLNGDLAMLDQSSLDGNGLTYTTSQGFGDSAGTPYVSQYLARRGAAGWKNTGISPPQGISSTEPGQRIDLEYRAFTDDLCFGFLRYTTDPQLLPGAPEGIFNVYRRDLCGGGGFQLQSTAAPPHGTKPLQYLPVPQVISADGRCIAFSRSAFGALRVIESCEGLERLVSVEPDGAEPNFASAGTNTAASAGIRSANTARSVSTDGSRVYWTAEGSVPKILYLRENADQAPSPISGESCTKPELACTIALPSKSGADMHFWSASPDGATVLYTLTGGGDTELVQYNVETKKLTSIATGITGAIMGASADAQRVAFASTKVLGSQKNPEGATAVNGKPNLYLFDATKTGAKRFQLVGTLTSTDAKDFPINAYSALSYEPYKHLSRVSGDGLHLAFMSEAALTGFDNTDANNGKKALEIFTYDASANEGAGSLKCVSCNPNGTRPSSRRLIISGVPSNSFAPALLPPFYTELTGPRSLSEDGRRVFFTSYEALSSADVNGKADVYEWEAPGSDPSGGKCTAASPVYSPQNGGCLSLISAGQSPQDSEFIDASPSGADVFFTTGQSLVAEDPGLIDIYDARIGGGFAPKAAPAVPCVGETCQAASPPPPVPGAETTARGPGNPKPKCRKGTHRVKLKGGRTKCVANKKSGKGGSNKSGKKKAGKSGGAGR
jgi:NHL repeat